MNKARRAEINRIIEAISALKEDIEAVLEEESEYMENMPENLQCSEKHEVAEEACSQLEEAAEYIDSVIENLENAKGE
ncbi:MAG: hypothetical protein J6A83_09100 [Clostridia bacterium]|nr:hypothetical protein [Clostridia bacterium]